jgi:NAD(P)-dependent dehydrogenase (short-subunit alcohol dehydrogenase family)
MNRIDMDGRIAVVTGGARGIGLAIAQRAAASGARVALWDRDATRLAEAAASLPGATAHTVDLTDEAAVRAAATATEAAHGRIDILVNNAGITGGNAPTWELPSAEWRRVVDINLIAPFLVASAVLPGMVARGYGRVVNIASVAGKEGNPNASHYSASKAGLIALTKSLGKELAGKGVMVNCITPAAAKTELFEQMTEAQIAYMLGKIPMGRFVQVEEIAALAAWLMSEECSFSTGGVFDITGGRSTY